MPSLDAAALRRIAVDAKVDPRTVQRFVRGTPLRSSLVQARIAQVLKQNGLGRLAVATRPPTGRAESFVPKSVA